jgi:hypothetical protein
MNGTEQHREMPEKGSPKGGAINETSDSSSWTGQPPISEPVKPSGTPPSHGGDKGSGRR